MLLNTFPLAILMVTFSIWSDAVRKRSPFILAGLCMLVVGYSINISAAPAGVKYFGTFFCVAGAYAAFPGTVAWCVILPTTYV